MENYHRILAAEAHMKHIQFRQETSLPGLLLPHGLQLRGRRELEVLVNSKYDRNTGKWECKKVPYVQLVK